jgi:hypothetical protein
MSVFHNQHGTARTIRAEFMLGIWAIIVTRIHVHVARVRGGKRESGTYLVLGNKKAPLLVACKRGHGFSISEQMQTKWTDMNCTQGTTPGRPPFRERTKRRRQPSIEGTAGTATNLTASATGVYSSSGVSLGPEPPTSST